MAVDLSCYTLAPPDDVEAALASLLTSNQEIFSRKFLISEVREANGILAKSFFMISLNEKSAANLVLQVVDLIKNSLGEGQVIVLHGNSQLM